MSDSATITAKYDPGAVIEGQVVVGAIARTSVVVGDRIRATSSVAGTPGPTGATGANGTNGQGVPTGGAAGQVLAKINSTDYNTEWVAQSGGGAWGSIIGTLSDQTDLDTALAGKVAKAGDTMTGDLILDAGVAQPDNARITLRSRQEWISPTHLGDLVRFQPMNDYWKAAMAWTDKNGIDKFAFVGHDYLASYSAALDKTFVFANINSSTNVITLTAHGWATGDAVWFSVSTSKLVDMPDGLFPYFRYYIRSIDANTISVHRTSAEAVADTSRQPLTSAHASATYTITKNNWHHHVSLEMSDASATLGSAGELHSRFAFNYDAYPGILRSVDLEIQQIDQPIKMLGSSNKEIQFGLNPERSGRRWSLQHHASTNEFRLVYYTSTGLSASAALQAQLSNGFIGLGGNPDASTYRLKVTGAIQATTLLNVGTTIVAGGNITSSGDVLAVGSAAGTQTTIWAKSNVAATNRAGTIRFTGEATGDTQYRGGFLAYDPLNNFVILGTHDTADALDASDIESIKLDRATGNITLAKPVTATSDITVPAEAYGAGWNGSNEVPTKNDLYDKIETISAGSGITEALAIAYAVSL